MTQQTGLPLRIGGIKQVAARLAAIASIVFATLTFVLTNIYVIGLRFETATTTYSSALTALGLSPQFYAFYLPTLQSIALGFNLVVALIIIARCPDELIALITAVTIVTFSSINLYYNEQIAALSQALWVAQGINALIALISDTLSGYLFPDGRVYPRWLLWFLLPFLALHLVTVQSILHSDTSSPVGIIAYLLEVGCVALVLASQVLRYRRVLTPEQRQQVKWVLAGIAFVMTSLSLFLLTTLFILPSMSPGSVGFLFLQFTVDDGLHVVSLVVIAVVIMNAILRRRLWDIDFAINRALGLGATLLLVGVLVALLTLLLNLFLPLLAALAIAGAGGIALFIPARQAIQRVIDIRIYGLRQPIGSYEVIPPPKPPVSTPGLLTGKMLDGIELHDLIAHGGMSDVYKGYAGGQMYAVKVLPTEHNEETVMYFNQEAEALRRFRQPNIVRLERFGSAEGIHYMVMEHVEGVTLRTYLFQHVRMPLEVVCRLADDLATAVDHIHTMGIVHRDLKPGNIMLHLDAAGVPTRTVLLDFGLARIAESAAMPASMGSIGTVEYIAPEQILSSKTVTQAADIYSLGVIVYEMLTGERPFRGNPGQMLFGHLKQPAPDPRDLVSDLPIEASFAVRRAMAKEPQDRYATAHEFAAALCDTATSASIQLY